ncbi:MAG: hypothetical protein WCI51_19440 [Lentisphaerota bacterium]
MNVLKITVISVLMGLTLGASAEEAATKQEIDPSDLLQGRGAFEKWEIIQTKNKDGAHYLEAKKKGWSFTPGKKEGSVLIPDICGQISEPAADKEGIIRKSEKFNTGKASIELKGGLWFFVDFPAKDSEVYNITFYVYGDNPKSVKVYPNVMGDNKPTFSIESHDVEDVEDGKWAKVNETIKVIGSGAKRIAFRLCSNDLMLVDDLTITKQEK